MSFVGSMLGAGKGSDWTAQSTNIAQPTTPDQATNTYNQAQSAIAQQQALLAALQAQNGITNQSNVFNQLQGVANGTGPNPAQAMLANATGANTANQAALMAGQRGAGANTGLIARQAAQQGAANQQNAVGQGASLQAQQSMNALNGMGNLATQQAGQQIGATGALTGATQGEQANVLGGIAAQNNAISGMQSNMNNANSNIQVQNSKAQQGLFGGLLGGAGSMLAEGGMIDKDGSTIKPSTNQLSVQHFDMGGGVMGQNMASPMQAPQIASPTGPSSNVGKFLSGMQPSLQSMGSDNEGGGGGGGGASAINAGMQKLSGKGFQSVFGTAASREAAANRANQLSQIGPQEPLVSSEVGSANEIGEAGATDLGASAAEGAAADETAEGGASSLLALAAEGGAVSSKKETKANKNSLKHLLPMAIMALAKGGQVPALVSPGERYLPPKEVDKVAKGKDPLKAGEKIPGKAKVKGNSYTNDTVPKTLEEGGIVLPKSIMESKHPHWEAHKFVSAILAKQGLKGSKKK